MTDIVRTPTLDKKKKHELLKSWIKTEPPPFVQLLWLPSLQYQKLSRFFNLVVRFLNEVFPDDFFPAYGTLLGFIREGRIIKHDDQIDFVFNKERLSALKKYVCLTSVETRVGRTVLVGTGINELKKRKLILTTDIENVRYSVMKVNAFNEIDEWPFAKIYISDAKLEEEVVWSFENLVLERKTYNSAGETNRFFGMPIPVNAHLLLNQQYGRDWKNVINGIMGHTKTHMELCQFSNDSNYCTATGKLL